MSCFTPYVTLAVFICLSSTFFRSIREARITSLSKVDSNIAQPQMFAVFRLLLIV